MRYLPPLKFRSLILLAALATGLPVRAQTTAIDFDPMRDGFRFENYRNEGDRWKDDLGADDLVRMFGARTSCDALEGKNCKTLRPSAAQWKDEMLEAMKIGHCEGMAVACLRMREGLPFKGASDAAAFQPGAANPYALRRSDRLENYIAYFWVTQTFDEVKRLTEATAAAGPVKIVQTLQTAFREESDTYVLRFAKYNPTTNEITEPHAIIPFAVEARPDRYLLKVYDNRYPGQTRSLTVYKDETQRWEYPSRTTPKSVPEYIGDLSTKTFSVTATSWREGRCFASKWRKGIDNGGCSVAGLERPAVNYLNAGFAQSAETAEFFLTNEGDMLVTDPTGKSIGYDPDEKYFFDDIPGSITSTMIGGFYENVPHYTVPYIESDEFVYSIVFSGRNVDRESDLDFVYAAPYFTVGLSGIKLDRNERLEANVSTNGEQITFIASADGQTPEVFYAFDDDDENGPSYYAYVEGVALSAGKRLTLDFDFDNGKLLFSDDDGNADEYDIKLVRVNPDGSLEVFKRDNIRFGKGDRYEMDFKDWNGDEDMCFKEDDEGNGFADEQCVEEENEAP